MEMASPTARSFRREGITPKRFPMLDQIIRSTQLLTAPHEHRSHEVVWELGERVTDDGGIVLAVDDRECPQVRAVTSSSMLPVNLAYSSVSSANETSFTWPWNGCRRQMSTRFSAISITL